MHKEGGYGNRVRGLSLTRPSLSLVPILPTFTPNLTHLELTPSANISDSLTLATLLLHLPRLESLRISGQDLRSRRRRLVDFEPEGHVGQALRLVADELERSGENAPRLELKSLVVRNTPLKLSSVDHFLEVCGGRLRQLALEGCGIDCRAVLLAEEFCPDLREFRLDAIVSTSAPAATPRIRRPPIELLRDAPVMLSSRLTTLHLASLPHLPVSTFSLFSTSHHASLRSLSLVHCDLTPAHLSHFTSITRLRLVDCPTITSVPAFVDTALRPDLGAGCNALRSLTVLGKGGNLPLRNLWELAMLGRVDGKGGLARLTVDSTSASDSLFNVGGIVFSLPAGLGSPMASTLANPHIPSALPQNLAPPPHLQPYLATGILSADLPPLALLQTLLAASDLEELSLFGSARADSLAAVTHRRSSSVPLAEHLADLARQYVGGALSCLPLIGWLFSPLGSATSTFPPRNPPVPSSASAPDVDFQLAAKMAFASTGLPTPPALDLPFHPPFPSPTSTQASDASLPTRRGWLKRRLSRVEPADKPSPPSTKRLRAEEVEWLVQASRQSGGRLRRVYV
ncbi:hypothetical protein NBRC10512_003547 [Rhodotorula toruloides]|uniref:RHTO0S02e03884g1_1 n=2 Tax=Rhodotorula toruloides TaxID=5286 RepID=A0A061AG72_RHOTO|nr:uncharacterized protein RHTO_01197 [Rhodotorula toruloides NP11]EMS21982.1 hypothetical protein RHTO_01197 [Rhodotorula toruloides NP11]CDR36568.1 RHTO0S02e03884g1_1 [Rhodotorula toruloides]